MLFLDIIYVCTHEIIIFFFNNLPNKNNASCKETGSISGHRNYRKYISSLWVFYFVLVYKIISFQCAYKLLLLILHAVLLKYYTVCGKKVSFLSTLPNYTSFFYFLMEVCVCVSIYTFCVLFRKFVSLLRNIFVS